jgi:hypothetical protein
MLFTKTNYIIATKEFPLVFDSEGLLVDDIEMADIFNDKEDAESVLESLDNPEIYQVLTLKITYEI